MNVPISPNYLFYLLRLWGFLSRTTLAHRLCEDGIDWLANIHNDKGTKVLKKTWSNICRVLEEIHEIAERHYEATNAR